MSADGTPSIAGPGMVETGTAEGGQPPEDRLEFVYHWLSRHSLNDDPALSTHLRSIGERCGGDGAGGTVEGILDVFFPAHAAGQPFPAKVVWHGGAFKLMTDTVDGAMLRRIEGYGAAFGLDVSCTFRLYFGWRLSETATRESITPSTDSEVVKLLRHYFAERRWLLRVLAQALQLIVDAEADGMGGAAESDTRVEDARCCMQALGARTPTADGAANAVVKLALAQYRSDRAVANTLSERGDGALRELIARERCAERFELLALLGICVQLSPEQSKELCGIGNVENQKADTEHLGLVHERDIRLAESVLRLTESSTRMPPHKPDFDGIEQICSDMNLAASLQFATFRHTGCTGATVVWRELFACALERLAKSCMAAQAAGTDAPPEQAFLLDPDRAIAFLTAAFEGDNRLCSAFWGKSAVPGLDFPALRRFVKYAARQDGQCALLRLVLGGPASARALVCALREDVQLEAAACRDALGSLHLCAALARHGQPCGVSDVPFRLLSSGLPSLLRCTPSTRPHQPLLALLLHCITHLQPASLMGATTTPGCDASKTVDEVVELDVAADCLDVLTTLAQTEHASANTRVRRVVLERVLTAVPTDETVTEIDLQSQIAGSVLGSIEVLRRRELDGRGRCKFALATLRFFRSLLVQTQWLALCPDVQAVFDHVDAHGSGNVHRQDFCRCMAELGCTLPPRLVDILFDDSSTLPVTTCVEFVQKWGSVAHTPFGAEKRPQESAQQSAAELCGAIHGIRRRLCERSLVRQQHLERMAVRSAIDMFVLWRRFEALGDRIELLGMATGLLSDVIDFPDNNAEPSGSMSAHSLLLRQFLHDYSLLRALCAAITLPKHTGWAPDSTAVTETVALKALHLFEALMFTHGTCWEADLKAAMATRELVLVEGENPISLVRAVADSLAFTSTMPATEASLQRAVVSTRILTALTSVMRGVSQRAGCDMMSHLGGEEALEDLRLGLLHWAGIEAPRTFSLIDELKVSVWEFAFTALEAQPTLSSIFLGVPESADSDDAQGNGCASALDQLFQTLAAPIACIDDEAAANRNSSPAVRHAAFRLLRELWDGAVTRLQPHCAAVGYLREKAGFWHVLCQPLKEQFSSFVPGQGNRATPKNIADYCCELSCRSHCLHIIVLERHHGMHSMFRCLGPDDVGVVLESVSDQMSLGPTPNPNTPTSAISRPGVRVRGPRGNVSCFRTNELVHVKGTTESKNKDILSATERRRRKEAQSPYRTLSASADWGHMSKAQKAGKLRRAVDDSLSLVTEEDARKMSPETPAVRVSVGQSVKLLKQRCAALVCEELKHEIEGEEPDWYIENWAKRFSHFFFAEHDERKNFWRNFSELGVDIVRFRTHVERQRYGPDFEFGIRRLRVLLPGGHTVLAGMPERALKANVLASLEHGQLSLLRSWRVYMEVVHLQHGDQTLKRGNLAMSPHLSPKPHSPKPKHLLSARSPPLSANPLLVGLNGVRSVSLETLNVLEAALRQHIQYSGRDEAHESWYWLSITNTVKEKCELFLAVLHHQLHEVTQTSQHGGEMQQADCWRFLALMNQLHQHVRERVLCQSTRCDDTNAVLPIFEALLTASLLLLQRVDLLRRRSDPSERQQRGMVTETYKLEDHQTLLDEVVGQACFCMRSRKVLHPDYGVELSPQIQRSEIDLDTVSPQARLLRRLFCIGAACVTTCVSMSAPDDATHQHTFERRQRACVDMITTNRVLPLLLTALDAAGTSISLAYKLCRQQEGDRAYRQPQPAGDGKHASLCEQIVADGAARLEAVLLLLLRIAGFAGGATAILEMGVLPTICRNAVFRTMMDIAPQARGFHSVQPHADSVQSCSVWWGYSSCNERCDVHQKCWCLVPELARTLVGSLHTQRARWGLSIECESAMDSQLNVLLANFAPLLSPALQLRTFTMAGLDETETIVALLSSLCMWWQHKLAVVTHGKCGALFDSSMRLTRDIIVLLRYPRDDGWLNPVTDEPRRRTEELRSRNTRHHMKMSAHVQAVSLMEKDEEKRTRDQRRYRRIRSWMLWYAKENRGKAADDGSKASKAGKKKKRGAARRSRALQATLQREDHDTRHALALDFHSTIERRMCSVLHYTLQAVRKLTPRLPRDGNVDVQAAEPLLPLHETQCFTRQYADGLGGTLPLSVGHCVLCAEHCLQEICGGDLSKWPRKERDKKREIEVLEQWVSHQQALRSMLFNAVHIITTNMRLHDMLYDFFRSQSLEQFHRDLKSLKERAEQLDTRNMYPPPMLPPAGAACSDASTGGAGGGDIYERLRKFRPTQLRSARIFRRVLMAQCVRHGLDPASGARPCVETRLESVVLNAIRSWHVTLRLEDRPSKRQQPGGAVQQLALEQHPQPMST